MTTKYHVFEETDALHGAAAVMGAGSTVLTGLFVEMGRSATMNPEFSMTTRLGGAVFGFTAVCVFGWCAYNTVKSAAHSYRNYQNISRPQRQGATVHLLVHVGALTPNCIRVPRKMIDLSL